MGWNPFKEAEKKAKEVVKKIVEPAARKCERWVYDVKDKCKASVRKVGGEVEKKLWEIKDQCKNSIRKVGSEVEDKVREVGQEIEDGITEKIPDLIEEGLKEIAEEASERSIKEVLDNAADVIEMMAPSEFTLIFGIELALVVQGEVTVCLTFPNPAAKLTEIRQWAKRPPKGRSQIIECIKDFGPDSLGAEFKISGNGISVEWDGEDKYDRVDAFLEKHGVD